MTSLTQRYIVVSLLVVGLMLAIPVGAHAKELIIPESCRSASYGGYESWKYLEFSTGYGGARVSAGPLKSTRRVARAIEHRIDASKRGLAVEVVNHVRATYDVSTAKKTSGDIVRVNKPEIVNKGKTASFLGLVKFTVQLKNSIGSVVESSDGSYSFKTHHEVTLTIPRQELISRDAITDLIRSVLKFNLFNFSHTYRLIPGGLIGQVRVSAPL